MVIKAVSSQAPPRYERSPGPTPFTVFEARVRALLEQTPDMPATVLAERVGWAGSIRWFRENVTRPRPQHRPVDPADRLVWAPGDAAQCDLWFPPRKIPVEDGSAKLLPVFVIITGVMAALVSDWFVSALTPAMSSLHISDAFAGLVIVAIAGNAVEDFVGIQLALKNRTEHALQVVLQSPIQIAMVVAPVVLLLSLVLGAPRFTLVLPPLLLASLLISALLAVFITYNGESTWY